MSSKAKTPKTGQAAQMRDWMAKQQKPFSALQICEELNIAPGPPRQKFTKYLRDFVSRGEITISTKQNRKPLLYIYNPAWSKMNKGTLNKRIFKAMYVSIGAFAATDIQRLSESPDRSWIDKVFKTLLTKGYLKAAGRRLCAHGAGAETLYHIPDRDKFRLEVLK